MNIAGNAVSSSEKRFLVLSQGERDLFLVLQPPLQFYNEEEKSEQEKLLKGLSCSQTSR
jgi:hypothetical protein